jgi:hypothetical protein
MPALSKLLLPCDLWAALSCSEVQGMTVLPASAPNRFRSTDRATLLLVSRVKSEHQSWLVLPYLGGCPQHNKCTTLGQGVNSFRASFHPKALAGAKGRVRAE